MDEETAHMYPYGLNETAKNSNLDQPTVKLFPQILRFSNRRESLEKRLVNEPTRFDTTDTLLANTAIFPPKNIQFQFFSIVKDSTT